MAFLQPQQYNMNVPAPVLPPGTYTGPYAAQGLRTTNPGQAAQLWESRHPGAVGQGNIPPWVMQALTNVLGQGIHPGQLGPHQNGVDGGVHPGSPPVPQENANGAIAPVQPGSQPNGGQVDPHAMLENIVNFHRQSNGLPAMHPEDLHGRVSALAQEIMHGRQNRLQRALRGIRPPAQVGPPQVQPQAY